jgi:hypothetical protein
MVWYGLPVKELYGLCIAVVVFVGGAFGAGNWLSNQTARLDSQARVTELEAKLNEVQSKMLERERVVAAESSQAAARIANLQREIAEKDRALAGEASQTAAKIASLTESNNSLRLSLRLKQQFLEHSLRYYQTKDQEHGRATKMFVAYLKEMWNGGKQDMEQNAYYIFHNPDRPTTTCYIMFKDDPVQYQIPSGIKGEVLDFAR